MSRNQPENIESPGKTILSLIVQTSSCCTLFNDEFFGVVIQFKMQLFGIVQSVLNSRSECETLKTRLTCLCTPIQLFDILHMIHCYFLNTLTCQGRQFDLLIFCSSVFQSFRSLEKIDRGRIDHVNL